MSLFVQWVCNALILAGLWVLCLKPGPYNTYVVISQCALFSVQLYLTFRSERQS